MHECRVARMPLLLCPGSSSLAEMAVQQLRSIGLSWMLLSSSLMQFTGGALRLLLLLCPGSSSLLGVIIASMLWGPGSSSTAPSGLLVLPTSAGNM